MLIPNDEGQLCTSSRGLEYLRECACGGGIDGNWKAGPGGGRGEGGLRKGGCLPDNCCGSVAPLSLCAQRCHYSLSNEDADDDSGIEDDTEGVVSVPRVQSGLSCAPQCLFDAPFPPSLPPGEMPLFTMEEKWCFVG